MRIPKNPRYIISHLVAAVTPGEYMALTHVARLEGNFLDRMNTSIRKMREMREELKDTDESVRRNNMGLIEFIKKIV